MDASSIVKYMMPNRKEIDSRITAIVNKLFLGKKPAQGRAPIAYVTIGVQGAGKSTAIKSQVPKSFVVVDPDMVTNILLGHGPLPDEGPVFSLSTEWTHQILKCIVAMRFDFVYDTALPNRSTLSIIKRAGYRLKMILVRTPRYRARDREVTRDMGRGWGRPGVSERSHRSTRDAIATIGPILVKRYVDEVTVCDNKGKVMKCVHCPMESHKIEQLFFM